MISSVRRLSGLSLLTLAVALAGVTVPGASNASPDTLKRAVGNVAMAPLDLVMSPLVAWATINTNIRDIDDTTGVRIAYFVPGYFWMLGVNVGASTIRAVTGGLELLPGVLLLPFSADLDPIYDPVERGEALVDIELPIMDVKFGINYQAPAY